MTVRQVRGSLFVDYVRMLRASKRAEFRQMLRPEDLAHLEARIEPARWYPMETFERFGNAILRHVANDDMLAVQMWGRHSAIQLAKQNPLLVAVGDPLETLNRFRVIRETFFDFPALEVVSIGHREAVIGVRYHMGAPAEEAASRQTMGFFEGLLPLADADAISAVFRGRSWAGDARTLLALHWRANSVRGTRA